MIASPPATPTTSTPRQKTTTQGSVRGPSTWLPSTIGIASAVTGTDSQAVTPTPMTSASRLSRSTQEVSE